jgi:hypothetical protein
MGHNERRTSEVAWFLSDNQGERVFEAGLKISCPNSVVSVICNGR